MQGLSSFVTLRPTDLITVGRSMANVVSGVVVGPLVSVAVVIIADSIFEPESRLGRACLTTGATLAGLTATFLFVPQVAIPLAAAKVAQVAILTALVAFGASCTQKQPRDKVVPGLAVGLLPTIGMIGTFLGSYAALTGGVIVTASMGIYSMYRDFNSKP